MELIRSSVELVNGLSDAIATAKMKAAKDPNSDESKAASQQLLEKGITTPTPDQIAQQVSQNYGIGSSFKKAAQAVSAVVQGVLAGNIGGALAGAATPYVAERIKMATEGDDAANLMAHAVWGAVLAKAQGNSALAGAAGASVGELIAHQLYPDKRTADLTESERQTVSALSTLAGGLAGAITGGNAAGAVTGAGTAQNAVDNNFLNQGRPDAYAARYAGCKGEPVCELTVRKDLAKESAENIDKLKGCWDAGDTVCVAKMREQIEIGRNAYTKLKTQDAMVGGGYEQVAEFYADVIDNCGGKCDWLEAALKKTIGDGINMAAYAVLGGGGAPKRSGGVGSTSEIGTKGIGSATEAGSVFTQQRNFWSKDPIQFSGNKVYQRNDLFDPNLQTSWREGGKVITGSNAERMASGRAPIGVDGKSVNLHHMTQTQSGPIAEMTQSFHQTNSATIHINPNTIPSGIDRAAFDKWKVQYWQQRSADFRN